jgi:hypothetical protein
MRRSYLFIFVPFKDTVSSSDYTASNNTMISELKIGENVEGSGRDILQGAISAFI